MDVQIKLIEQGEPDALLFADMRSVSGTESNTARQSDINAACVFDVWTAEYDGQREVMHNSQRMTIYRTYDRTDGKTELYAGERAGKWQ